MTSASTPVPTVCSLINVNFIFRAEPLTSTDPVFFLHHANLDRLWSKWQQKHNANAYGGKASMYSTAPASATDMLNLAGLMDAVPVSDVFSTTSGMFCYQY